MYHEENDWRTVRVLYDGGEGGGGDGGDGPGGGDGGGGTGGGNSAGQLPDGAIYADARFIDSLSDDVKGLGDFSKFKSVSDLATSWASGQKMLGKLGKDPESYMERPDFKDADARRGLQTQMGLPESHEGYTLEAVEGAPDWMAPDVENSMAPAFLQASHELGLLPEQVQGIYTFMAKAMAAETQNQASDADTKSQENLRVLQGEFGAAFDKKFAAADYAIDKFGGDALRDLIQAKGLATNPGLVKAFAKLGELTAEDGVGDERGGGSNSFASTTAAEAREKALELQREAMGEKDREKRRQLNQKAQEWWQKAVPAKAS